MIVRPFGHHRAASSSAIKELSVARPLMDSTISFSDETIAIRKIIESHIGRPITIQNGTAIANTKKRDTVLAMPPSALNGDLASSLFIRLLRYAAMLQTTSIIANQLPVAALRKFLLQGFFRLMTQSR
ncbi:hypothetical protein IMCC21224_11844 [Puniceibacterium sp. IMCC21224]|nr:hypothetical protein IMCC21224_11844 [Puniceibacterium sp. IMCC21224]